MRPLLSTITCFFAFALCGPALADECIKVTKDIGTFTLIKTKHGKMGVSYQTNAKLPIKTVRLSDGRKITGGVPGNIPMSFLQFDSNSQLQAISIITLKFATDRSAGKRTAHWYDKTGNEFEKTEISGRPVLQLRSDPFSPTNKSRQAVKIEFEIPNSILTDVCITPGPIFPDSNKILKAIGVTLK